MISQREGTHSICYNRHELRPFDEVHDGWQQTGVEGWLNRGTALAALKLAREHNLDTTFRLVRWDWTFTRTVQEN